MTIILGNKELNKLPTKINYSNYENGLDDCNRVSSYDSTKERLIKHDGLLNVSDKIMKALCYVYNKSSNSSLDKNICDFLYYWLSDKLLKHLTSSSSYNTVIGFLYAFLHNAGVNNVCKVLHWSMHEHSFDDIKRMFDYSKDYNTYMTQLTHDNIPCNKNYKNYFQAYVDSYKKLKSECEGIKKSYTYCNDFKTYFSNMDPNLLSTRTCKLVETEEQTKQIQEDSSGDERRTQLESKLTEKSVSGGQDSSSVSDLYSSSTGMSINPAPSTSSYSPITSKSITAVASTAGFLVPSFLMYKFTPAGTWINKLLGITPNINHIPLKDSGIVEQFPHAGRYSTENGRFNISYSPE
ncbi:VIR protein [Plasmodium vivax]|uniref:VIR protein n=1 Tax=Plasmodium vivax TaxID=5855 RepID=A0A1G4E8M1_PLAVI|nr:VIR protein [Plasmodium vivax]